MLFFLPADVRKQGTAGRNRNGFPTSRTTTTTTNKEEKSLGSELLMTGGLVRL